MYPREMSIMEAYMNFWKRAFDFSGRSRRKEYWVAILVNIAILFLIEMFLSVIIMMFTTNGGENSSIFGSIIGIILFLLMGIIFLISLVPSVSSTIRRIHDVGHSSKIYIGLTLAFLLCFVFIFGSVFIAALSNQDPSPIAFIPFPFLFILGLILNIYQLYFAFMDSQPGTNKWGHNPKGIQAMQNYHSHQ